MDSIDEVRSIIESDHDQLSTRIPVPTARIQTEAIFVCTATVVLDERRPGISSRVHGSLVHIDIIDGKLWIQRDGLEHGVVTELLEAGIPKDRIVMAYKSIETRRLMEFAVS